jgi:FixJ family two-component response regulator
MQEMINEGVRDILQKPYRMDTLTKKVKEILED